MRSFAHLTPRYVLDRAAWAIHQRRHPEEPWLTPRAVRLLDSLLLPSDRGIEWGSGRSTRWFARRLRHLISVEHVKVWFETVNGQLASEGIANVDYRLIPPDEGPTAATGGPRSPYVRVVDEVEDGSLQFALVDGYAREFCANAVLDKLACGGLLVVDNANWFLDHETKSPASRTGMGHLNKDWIDFAQRVRNWRHIWTSSGVTDTALWIKPG
jgi:hypothetical protein